MLNNEIHRPHHRRRWSVGAAAVGKEAMKRSEQEYAISEHLTGIFKIRCSGCDKTDEMTVATDEEAAAGFYEEGWRVSDEQLLCKKCMRKR